jgi:hypothetical protein
MQRLFFIVCLIVDFYCSHAQSTLYMPRNVADAYKKETRSMDGNPGKNYWQNHGYYDIRITVTPPSHTIQGSETITYVNNSPDTLKNPVLKLILNIHKPGALRYYDVADNFLDSGICVDAITANGKTVQWQNPSTHFTWQPFALPKALPPNGSVNLTIDWHFELATAPGREGMIDSSTYFLAYFYPRVAVFDDCDGWDRMNFTSAQEFYNDFNDYTLTVNAPKNYIVWATGTLQNTDEVLQPVYAKKLTQSMTGDSIIHIADAKDLASKNITAQNDMNVWKWSADNVTDITCAISNHFIWDASSVIVDNASKRRASVQAAYNDSAKDFHYMVGFGKHSLEWLSNEWPGVAYPFPKTTIVQGFADMEYPMMVNDNTEGDTNFTRFVVEHEIAHSWFPFYMGINEHRYGFMDEGWATTFEYLIGLVDLGKEDEDSLYKNFRVTRWIHDPSSEEDLPIITPGNILNGVALGNNEYGKASLGYLAMKDMLGDDLFRKCLHAFMERWHSKHPIPWDFFYTFNDVSGKNLNWFWNSWFFSNGYIDLGIQDVKTNANGYTLIIKNIGGFPAPTDVIITYGDDTKETLHETPAIWQANLKEASIKIADKKKIKSIELDGGIFMDADKSNNSWKAK